MPQFPVGYTRFGTYIAEQTTKYDTALYELDFTELWGLDPSLNFHKAIADLPIGLEAIKIFAKGITTGMADEYDGTSDDIRVIEVDFAQGQVFKTALFARAINWDWIESERQKTADQLGQQLPTMNSISEKIRLLGDFFNRREHFHALYGLQERGIYGMFSQKNCTVVETTFKPYIPFGTAGYIKPKQLYNDFVELIYNFRDRARLTSVRGIDIKVPPLLMRRLIEMYYDDANQENGQNILSMLLDKTNGLGINSINDHNELQGRELNKNLWNELGNAMYPLTSDRIVFKASVYAPERHFFPRKLFAPFQKSTTKYEQVCISASTGVIYKDITKLMYLDFSNAVV
jgi:hypothetical protein